jgi:hypothetical protein
MSSAKEQMDLAIRRNRGKRLAGGLVADVTAVLGRQITTSDLLDLEESDRLSAELVRQFDARTAGALPCYHVQADRQDSGLLFATLVSLGAAIPDEPVAVFGKHSRDIGALRLGAREVFSHALELVRLDGDDLRALNFSGGGDRGFLLDYSDHAPHFELWLWGEDWIRQIP